MAKPEIERCRWFDEGFAMYFEALAVREFSGDTAFQNHMDRLREKWIKGTESNKKSFDVPIAEYGTEGLGQNSYTKGAWSLYVLHKIAGDEKFYLIIRTFLKEFEGKRADFYDFKEVAEKITQRNLEKYFDEWIFGSYSSLLLASKIPIEEIAGRY